MQRQANQNIGQQHRLQHPRFSDSNQRSIHQVKARPCLYLQLKRTQLQTFPQKHHTLQRRKEASREREGGGGEGGEEV